MYVITFTDRINPLKSVAVTLMDRTQVGSKDVRQLRPEHEEKEILLPVSWYNSISAVPPAVTSKWTPSNRNSRAVVKYCHTVSTVRQNLYRC